MVAPLSSHHLFSKLFKNKSDNRSQLGVSPGKAAEIRGKSFGQLNALKQLYDDQVLTLEEFQEQKTVILSQLKGFK